MKGTSGRDIFVVDLNRVLGSASADALAQRAKNARMSAVWIRVGRGLGRDPNMALPSLPGVRQALANAGVELWGWHVPFCADRDNAKAEALKVLEWTDDATLAGIVIDAERTPDPRFQGQEAEADIYTSTLSSGLEERGCGVAFSSHDQPSQHSDFPFQPFLDVVHDVCPQVYYRSANPGQRLGKSLHDYKALLSADEFTSRYRPTGNITTGGDLPLPDVATCLTAARKFIQLVNESGYKSYSFWCWDTAPAEIWPVFNQTPV